jgi:hypothetical protein
MEKIINTLINSSVQGVDTYTHNNSTWLIFTESKQWVIELTGYQTLWYNYNFFKNIFAYVSLDAVQNQHLITKWVEDNVINVGKDIIEDIIEDGIIETYDVDWDVPTDLIENIIEDGNISTYEDVYHHTHRVEGVIKNGVKETKKLNEVVVDWIGDIIENGIKEVISYDECKSGFVNQFGYLDDIIENGVKEIKPLPSQTGNKDWSEYSHGKEDRTKPFNEYLNDTLEEGVKIN